MSVACSEFSAEELGGPRGHDASARLDPASDDRQVAGVSGDLDPASRVDAVAAIFVDPCTPADVVEHRAIRHDEPALGRLQRQLHGDTLTRPQRSLADPCTS